jgi:arylsulfatase A-like enzyme
MPSVTRRTFMGQVAGAAAATAALGSWPAARAAEPKRRLNVLFLMADDMRVELGCYGSRFGAVTPNLDALAKSGVRFDRNYCQYPLCNPSRTSLLTGRHPTTTRVLGNRQNFRTEHPDWVSLPQLFREHGYTSLRSGKIFHGAGLDDSKAWSQVGGGRDGESNVVGATGQHTMKVERADGPPAPGNIIPPLPQDNAQAAYSDRIVVLDGNGEEHGDYRTADQAIAWLREYRDRPFFLGCGFVKPHSPPSAPQRFFDLYDPNKLKLPPDFAPWPTVPPGFPDAAIRKRNADLFIGRPAGEAEAREVIRAYLAATSWTDWNVGRVLAELDRLGLRENTVIVFAVDHGYQLGEKGKWSKAGSLFEMGARVPLIVAVPGVSGNGRSCYRIVQSLDLYRTLAEVCDLPLPAGIEGSSLVPLLRNPAATWNEPAYTVWSEDGVTLHGVAVRTEKWRYVEYGPEGRNGAMLLDPKDPDELKNFADDPHFAADRAALSKLVRAYAAKLPAAAPAAT